MLVKQRGQIMRCDNEDRHVFKESSLLGAIVTRHRDSRGAIKRTGGRSCLSLRASGISGCKIMTLATDESDANVVAEGRLYGIKARIDLLEAC